MVTFRALLAYGGLSAIAIFLAFFASIAYPPLLVALLALSAGLWVTSERRWRSLLDFVWGPAKSARWAHAGWTRRHSMLLIAHGLIWLATAGVFFVFANIRLLSLFTR